MIKVNGTFLRWTGHERDDLVGKKRFADLLSAGGRIFYETHIAPMLRMQDKVREIAVEMPCADGRRLPVLVNAVLKRDDEGEPLVVRVAIFDATERRLYERELLLARKRAEESEARATVLARTLQASFIPPEPPQIPGLEVGAVYRPAGAGDEIGGDFYDVFQTRDDEWAVVLGDVCGKGAEAAAVTALARYTIRAAAMQRPAPSHALQTLNDAIIRQHPDRYCTALYARVDISGSRPKITLCVGGHLLPLLHEGGTVTEVGAAGTLLGVFTEIDVHEVTFELVEGARLVLFTDGITEARDPGGEFYGDRRLREQLAAATGTAEEVAEQLAGGTLEFQRGNARDDTAVVVLQAPSAG